MPSFDQLPPEWQAEIQQQIQQVGLQGALEANKQWLQATGGGGGDPAAAVLQQWINEQSAAQPQNQPSGTGMVTQNPTTMPASTGPQTGQSAPTAPTAGSTAYNTLLQMYQAQGGNPQDQDGFNAWTGNVTRQFGVQRWEDLPQDFQQRYNPSSAQPHPPGYRPPVQTTTANTTVPNVPGANYQQQQNSGQAGQFNTTGQTNTNQQQTSGSTTNQSQSGTSTNQQNTQQTGTTSQNTSGTSTQAGTSGQTGATTQNISGTTTTRPVDTLGFGSLLQGAAVGAGQSDKARTAFLQDVMATGGSGFKSQVDQGVRQAISGPGLTGAGDSARARAAGYAGAQIGRNNLDQRLGAAGQLGNPNAALTSLSTAANPYIGQSQTNQGTSTGTNTTSGFQNLFGTNNQSSAGTSSNTGSSTGTSGFNNIGSQVATGFQNLLGQTNEANSGSTSAQGSQAAAGIIPQGQAVPSSGGCVLCTAAIDLGLSRHHRVLRFVIDYKLRRNWSRFKHAARGYFYLFTPLARWLLSHPRIAAVLWPMAKAVVYEELRIAGRKLPARKWASLVHWTGHYLCAIVGRLPVPRGVTDKTILNIANREGILFRVLD